MLLSRQQCVGLWVRRHCLVMLLLSQGGGKCGIITLLAQQHLLLTLVHLGKGLVRVHSQLLGPLCVHDVQLAECWIRHELRSLKKHVAVVVLRTIRVVQHGIESVRL